MIVGSSPGRAGSFYINANKAGEAAVLTALLALPALTRRTALPILALAGVAVLVTFSRSAMIAWMLVALLFMLTGRIGAVQVGHENQIGAAGADLRVGRLQRHDLLAQFGCGDVDDAVVLAVHPRRCLAGTVDDGL